MQDKRREWAAAAACQIINQVWRTDAPPHIIYAEIEKIIHAALIVSAAELRRIMLEHSEN